MKGNWKGWAFLAVLFISFSTSSVYSLEAQKGNPIFAALNFFGKSKKETVSRNKKTTNHSYVADNHDNNGNGKKNNDSVFGGKGPNIDECPDDVVSTCKPYGSSKTSIINTALIEVSKTVPEETWVENEFSVDLCVKALADVKYITIIDEIKSGGSFVKSDPPAQVDGNKLTWNFDSMECGEEKTLRVTARADSLGDMEHCVSVIGGLDCCVKTFVGKSDINLSNLGPECYRLDECKDFVVRVANDGDAISKNVHLTVFLPEGFKHDSGDSEIKFELGDMVPCEVKDVSVPLLGVKRGNFCNQIKVTADNNEPVYNESCIDIILNSIEIAKSGTPEQFIYKNADYTINVSNNGDVELNDVVLNVSTDANVTVVDAPGSSSMECNSIQWCIPSIKVGETQTYTYVGTSTCPGTHDNQVSVAGMGDGVCGMQVCADACAGTLWKGHPALNITAVETCDPILVDDVTTYTIRIVNQGTAADQNVRITALFSEELTPIEGSGNWDFSVNGQEVSFEPIANLDVEECVEFKIDVKAMKTGDARVKVELNSDLLQRPLGIEESTQVY